MKTAIENTVEMVDKMSRSNTWSGPDGPTKAADHLLGAVFYDEAIAACNMLLSDGEWSQDREPYNWLKDVIAALDK